MAIRESDLHGAASGELERGETAIAPMRAHQPWPTGGYAEALRRGRAGARPG